MAVALHENNWEAQDSFLECPEASLVRNANRQPFTQALEELPIQFREVLVLRELENLSYNQIADVTGLLWTSVMLNLSGHANDCGNPLLLLTTTVEQVQARLRN